MTFLRFAGLNPSSPEGDTVLLRDEAGKIAACGTREGNVLKYFAVAPDRQGEGLTGTVVTELRKAAFADGIQKLFVYTKPKNGLMFEGLNFHKVAETESVLLLESTRGGIGTFLSREAERLAASEAPKPVGAVVMKADPFTAGHRYLVESAAAECGRLYVFVLSSGKGLLAAEERLRLVKEGTADLENVRVCTTGDYLVSSVTFPDYFLKRESSATVAQCGLDCAVFAGHFAPAFGITRRYVGSEPLSEVTEIYNRTMERLLPAAGIEFTEIPRLCLPNGEPISASKVRALLENGDVGALKDLLPASTYDYLENKGFMR